MTHQIIYQFNDVVNPIVHVALLINN